jgi:hypothetical protein
VPVGLIHRGEFNVFAPVAKQKLPTNDMALHKVTKLTESKSLELRVETFNTFNHAQFYGNGPVDGNINDATFGEVVKAAPPRISQVAIKLLF